MGGDEPRAHTVLGRGNPCVVGARERHSISEPSVRQPADDVDTPIRVVRSTGTIELGSHGASAGDGAVSGSASGPATVIATARPAVVRTGEARHRAPRRRWMRPSPAAPPPPPTRRRIPWRAFEKVEDLGGVPVLEVTQNQDRPLPDGQTGDDRVEFVAQNQSNTRVGQGLAAVPVQTDHARLAGTSPPAVLRQIHEDAVRVRIRRRPCLRRRPCDGQQRHLVAGAASGRRGHAAIRTALTSSSWVCTSNFR